ncbi:MAG: shikimate dehydrogenase, partial [Acidimicrobiia bacterium]
AAALAGERGRVGTAADVAIADLIVNATPVGMGEAPATDGVTALPFDPDLLRAGSIVAELVYHPSVTPLMGEAVARGARAVGGLGMLVHQAARAIELWSGRRPPVDVMWGAARDRLGNAS